MESCNWNSIAFQVKLIYKFYNFMISRMDYEPIVQTEWIGHRTLSVLSDFLWRQIAGIVDKTLCDIACLFDLLRPNILTLQWQRTCSPYWLHSSCTAQVRSSPFFYLYVEFSDTLSKLMYFFIFIKKMISFISLFINFDTMRI